MCQGRGYGEFLLIKKFDLGCASDCYLLSLPLCFVLFNMLLRVNEKAFAPQKILRKLSTIIYCSHYTILSCLGIMSMKLYFMDKLAIFIMTLVLCHTISFAIFCLDKTKAHSFIQYAY